MTAARPAKHVHGAAWLDHVKKVLAQNNIIPEALGGALRLCNGGARITTAELHYLDPRDLSDLLAGRVGR